MLVSENVALPHRAVRSPCRLRASQTDCCRQSQAPEWRYEPRSFESLNDGYRLMDGVQHSKLPEGHQDPVRQLLIIGETSIGDPADWPDYTADPGIGHEHVSASIRLACDVALHHGDSSSSAVWAPLHAWRALAHLRAEAGVAPLRALLKLIEDDEAADLELPVVFGMIGPAAIPHIAASMANPENPGSSVAAAISGLSQIAARHANCRDECMGILVRTLEPHAGTDPTINGFAVAALIDLCATEAIDTRRIPPKRGRYLNPWGYRGRGNRTGPERPSCHARAMLHASAG
jgi:hypothetical protein